MAPVNKKKFGKKHFNIGLIVVVLLVAAVGTKLLFFAHAQNTQVVVEASGSTYASSVTPQQDHSTSTLLRTNTDPDRKSYLLFNLSQSYSYTSATFKVYANQNSSKGFTLYKVANNWTPKNVTYTNQPTLGAKIASSGAITKDSWVSIDVSSVVKQAGVYGFGMVANDGTEVSYNSATATTNKPQLVAQYSATVTPPPPNGSVVRAAFYYPWFPNAWNQQGFNPFTNYHPSLGFYSSSDTNVIKNHISAMQYGHLDAGIVSWWGQGSQQDHQHADQYGRAWQ